VRRARIALPLLAFGALVAVACAEPIQWTPVISEDGRFRVEMPGVPRELARRLDLPFGAAPVHLWVVDDGDRAFIAGYIQYPDRVESVASSDELLDSARDDAVEKAGGVLVQDEPRELLGHRGRSIEIEARDGAVRVRGAFYVADSRLYRVLATTTPDEARSERVERFLASFELTPPDGS
jgi:hypothetical protein